MTEISNAIAVVLGEGEARHSRQAAVFFLRLTGPALQALCSLFCCDLCIKKVNQRGRDIHAEALRNFS
jgi:hypothetical protein